MKRSASKSNCAGELVRELRVQAAMTQEKLAMMSNVNLRTVQRAESGEALQLDTIASIAAALKVGVNEITRSNDSNDENNSSLREDSNVVALRKINSGKILMDIVCDSFSGEIYCDAEPTVGNIEFLGSFVEIVEGLMPNPWQSPSDRQAMSLAERLRKSVIIKERMDELETFGIVVYAGTYTASSQVPRYDHYEGHMYIRGDQKYEPVTVCRVVVGRIGVERVTVKVNDKWEESPPPDFGKDDDIPF